MEAIDAHGLALAGENRPGPDLRRGGARVVDLGAADHLGVALSQGVERRRRRPDRVDDDGDVARLERLAGRERRVDRRLAHLDDPAAPRAARAAASRAIGTRNGEQET